MTTGREDAGRPGGCTPGTAGNVCGTRGRPLAHTRDEVLGGAGTRLAVRVSGPPGAPAVLLVHGWAQSARVWTRQLDGPLAERYRVIAVDLRGHGDSAAPAEGYESPAVWAQDVRALLDYAGAPALLVGW